MAPLTTPSGHTRPRLIIHGGAGHITRANLPPSAWPPYQQFLTQLLTATQTSLLSGSSALSAATTAVAALEDCSLFNCGRGAVFTRAGTIELEASVMVSRGYRKRGVGITLVKRVKNPILFAREMLVRGEVDGGAGVRRGANPSGGAGGAQGHCFLGGETVEALAEEFGVERCEERWHWTRRRWEEHLRGLEGLEGHAVGVEERARREEVEKLLNENPDDDGWDGGEYLPQGTVGCVCLDMYGTLCAATSTGGLTNKLPGRVGDTPTLGAGFWAEEWETPAPSIYETPRYISPLEAIMPDMLRNALRACVPSLRYYAALPASATHHRDEKKPRMITCGVAMSGTGNGDSFLRINAVRTAAAINRFAPGQSLASAVKRIAGPGGELQASAGDRWGKTGEGEGGIIGIGVVDGKGEVVFDFNCGGMFRAWVDDEGRHRCMVFKEEY